MKNYLLLLSFLILPLFINSQTITFGTDEILFEHPNQPDTYLNFPFIPFDYNNDGLTDYTGSSQTEQYAYKGLEDGSFEQIVLNWEQKPIKVIDWNNDGKDDAVFQRHISITGDDDDFFISDPSITSNVFEVIVDVADLNNDSFLDFITIERRTFDSDILALYMNNGDDTFEKSEIDNTEEYEVAVLGDINNDEYLDIVYSGFSTYVGINNKNGTFTISDDEFERSERDILLTDLDNDSDLDLVILDGLVTIYKNVDGSIQKSNKKEVFNSARSIKSGDFNGDQMNDLISISYEASTIDINLMTNDGSGNFDQFPEKIVTYPLPEQFGIPSPETNRNNFSIYDHDQDGKLDIIYVDGVNEPNTVRWLKNTTIVNSIKDSYINEINVYPNPADNYLKVDAKSDQFDKFEIINLNGQIVKRGTFTSSQIDIEELETGQYQILLYPNSYSDILQTVKFSKI
ncbi:MAG: FG-GAP-like repeat-containing protein [Bacteroidota bacterium]